MEQVTLIKFIQITFTILTVVVVSMVVFWAFKSKQFKNMDRASRLPLDIDESLQVFVN